LDTSTTRPGACSLVRPDGKILASAHDGHSFFWEVRTGKNVLEMPRTLSGVAFASDNKTFFCSVGGSSGWSGLFTLHELGTGTELKLDETDERMRAHRGIIRCMASTSDGKTLATGSDDKTIRIWNVAGLKKEKRQIRGEVLTGFKTVQILKGHADEVRFVIFSEDGKRVASVSKAGDFKLWDVESGKELSTLFLVEPGKEKADVGAGKGRGSPVAISRDFKTLALGTRTGEVKLWDVASGKVLATRQVLKAQAVTAVALSLDGKMLATAGGNNTVQVWDVATGKNLAALAGHTAVVQALCFSPVDPILASAAAGPDYSIKLWELIPGK
jgi:WD40 repeat protein